MYALYWHKTLTPERWATYPTDQQLLMIGNEVNRLMNNLKTNFPLSELKACMERALELIDLTVDVQSGSLRYELLRWRELFVELYLKSESELQFELPFIEQLQKVLLLMNAKSAMLIN